MKSRFGSNEVENRESPERINTLIDGFVNQVVDSESGDTLRIPKN